MNSLYTLVLVLSLDGYGAISINSDNNLSMEECSNKAKIMSENLTNNPPFSVDKSGTDMVIVGSKPIYLCVPAIK